MATEKLTIRHQSAIVASGALQVARRVYIGERDAARERGEQHVADQWQFYINEIDAAMRDLWNASVFVEA